MKKLHILSLGAVMLAAGAAFGAIRAVTPTAWNGKPDCWQMKRHQQKMESVKKGGAKVVFIGDSITHFWESKGKEQLGKYFSDGDMKMLDLGTSADRTEHVLWRLNNGELDGYEAKCVLLMIGTNNAGHFKNFADETPMDTILGIREILKKIREKQPNAIIVLTAIFPRGASENDSCRLRNDAVNKEIRRYCDGKTIFWCDFSDRLVDEKGDTNFIMKDRLHPDAPGYEIWYEEVKPYIQYALSDGAKPCPKNRYSKVKTYFEKKYASQPATVTPSTRIGNVRKAKGKAKSDDKTPQLNDWWSHRMLKKRNQIVDSKGEIDIVFFGDSITHNWEGPGKASLAELSKTYSILDIGYGGDRTQHLIWRGLNGELDGFKTKCVMLMIGTNNREPVEDIAKGVRRVLDVIAEKQPQAKTLLLPIFMRGKDANDVRRVANEKVNAIIKGYADGEKVIWVDFNSKFLDANGDTKWIMKDRLHPNAEGYKNIWMPEVLPYFKKICGK
jgi:lysophospholipase L1-like esterase